MFLPGKSHGQRNLVSYSPKVRKESDTTQQLSTRPWVVRFQHTFSTNVAPLLCSLTSLSNTDLLSLSSTDGPLNRLFPMSECSFPPSFAWFSPHPATDSKTSSLSIFSRSPPFSQPPCHWWSFFVTQDCASPMYNCHWACLILCFLFKLAKINWIIMCQPISIYSQLSNTLIFITPTWSRWKN